MKIAAVDIETTGLDPRKHEIIEIGVVLFESETGQILETLNLKVKPERPEDGEPKAYEVNGYTEEAWKDGMPLTEAMYLFREMTSGARMMAYNITFDWGFIQEAFRSTGASNGLHYHKLCLMSMAIIKLPHDKVKSWKLKDVAESLGIPPEPSVHRALNGAMSAYEVYKQLK